MRIQSDIENLGALGRRLGNRLLIERVEGNPAHTIILQANFRTARSADYPAAALQRWTIRIELPSEYPTAAPKSSVDPIVYHPNVWTHGAICMGNNWSSGEFLDLYVLRILKTLTFDPLLTNVDSPANREAAEWYRNKKHDTRSFPSDQVKEIAGTSKPTMHWVNR
jgi:ubiquitin-protein ligase